MKKLLFPLLAILLITACKKEGSTGKGIEQSGDVAQSVQANKIKVCHIDKETGTSHTITININAWPAHQAHGDVLGDCSEGSVTICDQVWMVKNLEVTTYRNGDPIPLVTDPDEWANLTTGAWCYYENNSANGTVYGKLYNWYAVNDSRGLAPAGWHVPSDAEWTTLADCLGGVLIAGGKLKETGTVHWFSPNTDATNSSGFTGLPGGHRSEDGTFSNQRGLGRFWSSTEGGTFDAKGRVLAFFNSNFSMVDVTKTEGYSVRCVRN